MLNLFLLQVNLLTTEIEQYNNRKIEVEKDLKSLYTEVNLQKNEIKDLRSNYDRTSQEYKDLTIVFKQLQVEEKTLREKVRELKEIDNLDNYLNDLKKENIAHQAILYKNELFHKIGKYGTDFKVSEDYVFNIKCFQDETVKKIFIDKIFVLFNDTATSSHFRDGFLKYRLTYFKNLTFKEKLLKLYFYYRPDWFVPTKFFRK